MSKSKTYLIYPKSLLKSCHSQNQPNSQQAEGSNDNNSSQSKKDDDIVDAEFEEVKDEDEKDNKK